MKVSSEGIGQKTLFESRHRNGEVEHSPSMTYIKADTLFPGFKYIRPYNTIVVENAGSVNSCTK